MKLAYLAVFFVGASQAQDANPSAIAAGENLFFGKAACATCHQVNASGGNVGPDLSNAGRLSVAVLRQKILDPNTTVNAGGRGGTAAPVTVVVTGKTGQEIRGVRRSEDSFGLVLVDATGKLQRLDKRALASVRTEQRSLMPSDYGQRLSETEVQNLVAYLRSLNGRDFSKTIQADIPGGLSFDRIRNSQAEPQNWLTYWGDYQGHHSPRSRRSIRPTSGSFRRAGPCRCRAIRCWNRRRWWWTGSCTFLANRGRFTHWTRRLA